MGEDTVAQPAPEDSQTGHEEDKRARLETARRWLFDDNFVRKEAEEDLKAAAEADAAETQLIMKFRESALNTSIDPNTGLYDDESRATQAYDEIIHVLMPGGDPRGLQSEETRAVAAWGGRTGADYARDFEEVARETGIDISEIAQLNSAAVHGRRKLELYRFVFPVVEMMVLDRGYSLSLKYNR